MIEYRLIRSDRRTLSISIDREGALVVHAPMRMSVQDIEAFILKKQDWILQKQQTARSNAAAVPALSEGEQLPFWGGMLTIGFYGGKKAVVHEGMLWLPSDGKAALHARKWRLQQAQALLVPRVQYWAQRTGYVPQKIGFGNAKSRWGSMNAHTKSLRLNAALVHCPPALADYVIVHELMHMRHQDHSPAFHASVRAVMTDADARRAQLKNYVHFTTLWS